MSSERDRAAGDGAGIEIRIRLFAIQRELAKTRELTVRLPDGATVADVWDALVERHPVLASGRASVRFARNGTYVAPDEELAAGDEVAVIPPVSGGASSDAVDGAASGDAAAAGAGRAAVRTILELRPDPLPGSILEDLAARLATPEDGAVVGFIGRTRVTPGTPAPGQEDEAARHGGERVDGLEYEALEPMALAILAEIAADVRARFGVERLAIVHRTGEVPLGEASVAIVAVAPHRDAAFLAARHAIDETKARAPIWKAERFASGHVWVGSPARTGLAPDASGSEGQ